MSADTITTPEDPALFDEEIPGPPPSADTVTPDPPDAETDRLDELPTGPVTLASGLELEVVPMDLRETMKLLKIITHGAGPALSQQFATLDFEDPNEFAQTLLAIIIMSVGDAENELIEFIQAMCRPVGLTELAKTDRAGASRLAQRGAAELDNPSLDDTISILTRIVAAESENLRSLGKRIGTLTRAFQQKYRASAN